MMILGKFFEFGILLISFLTVLEGLRLGNEDVEEVLYIHNSIRRDFANGRYGQTVANMGKLRWNEHLVAKAEELVDCAENQEAANPTLVENQLNRGFSLTHNLTEVVMEWFLEVTHYLPQYGTCLTIDICRHFLTMINSKHHSIGCASIPGCNKGTLLLCVYRGGTFYMPYVEPGATCTKCDAPSSFCEDGLCVPCFSGRHLDCDCRKTCRRQNVGIGHLDQRTCTCRCQYGLGPNCDDKCVNPEQYEDWDPCADVTRDQCNSYDRDMLREFCPEQCVCRKHPETVNE